jgi:predicted nucleic acid-binding protein
MNVYVETNFVLELVFQQEQSESCADILRLCESPDVQLFIPAYCLAEPHEKLRRQSNNRQELQRTLNAELKQLSRTASYAEKVKSIQDIASLLIQSNEEERLRFSWVQTQILQIGTILPLTAEVLLSASLSERVYDLRSQDAIVFSSILGHIQKTQGHESCFLNRNSRDFDNPDIVDALAQGGCRMIPKFDDGYRFIQSRSTAK